MSRRRVHRGRPQRARRARRARWVAAGIATCLLGVVAGGATLARGTLEAHVPDLDARDWLRRPGLTLRSVDVLGLVTLDATALVERSGLCAGVPLVDLDLEGAIEAISSHPRVAAARGTPLPPDRVLLEVEERVPVAALGNGSEGFDASGARFPLAPGEAEGLPALRGEPDAALPLLAALAASGASAAEIVARAPGDVRFRRAGESVWIRVGADPARSLRDLGRLELGGWLEDAEAEEIDLRFRGNAVLRRTRDEADGTGG